MNLVYQTKMDKISINSNMILKTPHKNNYTNKNWNIGGWNCSISSFLFPGRLAAQFFHRDREPSPFSAHGNGCRSPSKLHRRYQKQFLRKARRQSTEKTISRYRKSTGLRRLTLQRLRLDSPFFRPHKSQIQIENSFFQLWNVVATISILIIFIIQPSFILDLPLFSYRESLS